MFNDPSGQVFKEWSVSRKAVSAQSAHHDWSRKPSRILEAKQPSKGPRALVDMAIRVVAKNAEHISQGHLDLLPPTLVLRIWEMFDQGDISFHAWNLFSKTLANDGKAQSLGLHRFHQHIKEPRGKLEQYTRPLTSLSIDFITNLVVSGGCDFTTNEMLSLADMKNLGVLDFTPPESGSRPPEMTDRLVRGWSEKHDPFPLLRVLRTWGNRSLTKESLRWVSKFPALTLFEVVQASGNDWTLAQNIAEKHGWKLADTSTGSTTIISRYLMMFAASEQGRDKWFDAAAETELTLSEEELRSVYANPLQPTTCVPDGQVLPLFEYFIDHLVEQLECPHPVGVSRSVISGAKVDTSGVTGFWLCSAIEQLIRSRKHKVDTPSGMQRVAGSLVLPSKPMACVYLGQRTGSRNFGSNETLDRRAPAYENYRRCITRRFTFIREPGWNTKKPTTPQPISNSKARDISPRERGRSMRSKKRQRLTDMLQTFSDQQLLESSQHV